MSRRQSFAVQLNNQHRGPAGRRGSTYAQRLSLAEHVGTATDEVTAPFTSTLAPNEMRQLALVAHNHMKPAMKQFIETYSEILKKFRITGTQTTMKMCKSMWGEDDPAIHYGLTCTSGPLGGDAQIAALMCMEDLGGIIFFVDPLSAHPHQADIDSLLRLANCGNVIVCSNPASASSMMHTLRSALLKGERARGIIPSFFETLESPAVEKYKHAQAVALANMIKGNPPSGVPIAAPQAAVVPKPTEEKTAMEEGRRAALSKCEDHVDEAPVKQGWKKAAQELSDSAVDRALMGQSMIFSADLQALLLAELDNEDYLEEEEDEVVAAPKTALSAPAAAANEEKKAMEEGGRSATDLVEDVEMNNKKAVPPKTKRRMYSKKAVPSMSDNVDDLALMGLDYSTHLEGLMVLEEEDEEVEDVSEEDDPEEEDDDAEDDSEEGEDEDVVFPAPIAKAKLLKSLFGFKTSSLMSKGRTDVKMFGKTVRKQRQHSEKEKARERQAVQNLREGLLTAKRDLKQRRKEHKKQVERLKRQCELQENDRSYDKSLTSMEQRTSALEEGQLELLVLAKQQMNLIENLTKHHARVESEENITAES